MNLPACQCLDTPRPPSRLRWAVTVGRPTQAVRGPSLSDALARRRRGLSSLDSCRLRASGSRLRLAVRTRRRRRRRRVISICRALWPAVQWLAARATGPLRPALSLAVTVTIEPQRSSPSGSAESHDSSPRPCQGPEAELAKL